MIQISRERIEEIFSLFRMPTIRFGVQNSQLSLPFELLKATLHNTYHRARRHLITVRDYNAGIG